MEKEKIKKQQSGGNQESKQLIKTKERKPHIKISWKYFYNFNSSSNNNCCLCANKLGSRKT